MAGRSSLVTCAVLATAIGCGAGPPTRVQASRPPATRTAPPPRPVVEQEVPAAPRDEPSYSGDALMAHVRRLTAEKMAGRRAGSREERATAEYITAQLEATGVGALAGGKRTQTFKLPRRSPAGEAESLNVYGLVQGASPDLRAEIVVVGAHFDHLGIVRGKVHHGAEDNASGVAVVLELAAALAARPAGLGRSVLFAFFGAEEIGLVGSRAFVQSPPVELPTVAAMVNVDMIGRPLADRSAFALGKRAFGIDSDVSVGVLGTKGRPTLRKIVDDACAAAGIRAVAPEDFPAPIAAFIERQAEGRGDNFPFERAGVPAVFFSSGESDDYHEPTDLPETLVPAIMSARAAAIHRVVVALSTADRAGLVR